MFIHIYLIKPNRQLHWKVHAYCQVGRVKVSPAQRLGRHSFRVWSFCCVFPFSISILFICSNYYTTIFITIVVFIIVVVFLGVVFGVYAL